MNEKLGLDPAFLNEENPFDLFKAWMEEAKKSEPNDPNAVNVATVDSAGQPDNRVVLLKGLTDTSFIFYTNLESKKSKDLKGNPKASMCFHWKSLLRQIRIQGSVELVDSKTADEYYNSRPYGSRIGAWASSQSEVMKHRDEFENKIKEFKEKYPDENNVPRPAHWSGWALTPYKIEFWKDVKNRLHQRLCYSRIGQAWSKEILYP
ncbi:pyridoxamine 5'-phosphate oxidase [Candidatus Pelagibacter sp. HIMB1517]|jgi:pyridoxamine 5'-phosphate oxidase|uniref:pyridoxamine 5'-phosphate oxidase n=1 Tax=unclassified Candidatus Pelagibacter TaxID=2647897 RepID=UPI003127E0D9|tara:strand:- start:738 stop:1355 length:618 start_codon:yes stop_codon:yes gene_type:complete